MSISRKYSRTENTKQSQTQQLKTLNPHVLQRAERDWINSTYERGEAFVSTRNISASKKEATPRIKSLPLRHFTEMNAVLMLSQT
jgi:hypothetical protein